MRVKSKFVMAVLVTAVAVGALAADPSPLGGERPYGGAVDLWRAKAVDCTGMSGPGQPMGEYDWAYTSDPELAVRSAEALLDDTMDVAPLGPGAITGFRWWGISWEWDEVLGDWLDYCGEDDLAFTPFQIVFYSAAELRVPACPVAVRTVVPTIQDTGLPWGANGFNVMEYHGTFAPVDGTEVAWIAVERLQGQDAASGNSCFFLRVNEAGFGTYDDAAYQIGGDGLLSEDLPYCVDATTPAASYADIFVSDFEMGTPDCWSAVVP